MKLDPKLLKYMTKDQFRVLSAVEQGSKNHHLVPLELIVSIAGLRHGGAHKIINQLLRNKLVARNSQKYEGYRLTYLGYDFLALRVFLARGTITGVGQQIGVGKESDIFLVKNDANDMYALKLHRLGRVSFKAIKQKRDYLQGRHKGNWLYLSRLAATKEYAFMQALHKNGFAVPTPIDQNRHCVVMGLCTGFPLYQVKEIAEPRKVYNDMMAIIVRLARYGLIHCDFNEFNLMVSEDCKVTVIDFPQMVSTEHLNAKSYFDRDVQCIRKFFTKVMNVDCSEYPKWGEFGTRLKSLDSEVKASGFTTEAASQFEKLLAMQREMPEPSGGNRTEVGEESAAAAAGDDDAEDALADADAVAAPTPDAVAAMRTAITDEDSLTSIPEAAAAIPVAESGEAPTSAADDSNNDQKADGVLVDTTASAVLGAGADAGALGGIPSLPGNVVGLGSVSTASSSASTAVMNRLRSQRAKGHKARQRRTATRNKNKNRAKRELKRAVKAQSRTRGDVYILA